MKFDVGAKKSDIFYLIAKEAKRKKEKIRTEIEKEVCMGGEKGRR